MKFGLDSILRWIVGLWVSVICQLDSVALLFSKCRGPRPSMCHLSNEVFSHLRQDQCRGWREADYLHGVSAPGEWICGHGGAVVCCESPSPFASPLIAHSDRGSRRWPLCMGCLHLENGSAALGVLRGPLPVRLPAHDEACEC
ncbi:hypothetical protein EDB92DRAFT_1154675 [Lactarius akahatsu]|uniref:Uncharacterized protein n=1 Tax=Lactarius akahatsu TaxID=416441 RepID=A0AAD4L2R7_9AGAM|nr:hypothetical protein EDB92DRAFT_1154675 [Lactarius akahatsu]